MMMRLRAARNRCRGACVKFEWRLTQTPYKYCAVGAELKNHHNRSTRLLRFAVSLAALSHICIVLRSHSNPVGPLVLLTA
jgi:hypothetical protein